MKHSRIRPEDLLAIAAGNNLVERAVSDQFSFQNLEQVAGHFRAIDKRLDIANALRKPYRRRRQSLFDSLNVLIQRRHDIIHRGEISTEFSDDAAFKALEDLEVAITRVYRMITTTYKWQFVQNWASGIMHLRKKSRDKIIGPV